MKERNEMGQMKNCHAECRITEVILERSGGAPGAVPERYRAPAPVLELRESFMLVLKNASYAIQEGCWAMKDKFDEVMQSAERVQGEIRRRYIYDTPAQKTRGEEIAEKLVSWEAGERGSDDWLVIEEPDQRFSCRVSIGDDAADAVTGIVARAIDAAIAEERNACLDVIDDSPTRAQASQRIRARSNISTTNSDKGIDQHKG